MKNDLTLRKIKNTKFSELYNKFIIGEKLNNKQYESLLAIAICFTNAKDIYVQQLGYRIIVDYCNQTKSYGPLYEIAINKGLYPISKFIENNYIDESMKTFFTEWNDAFTQQYVKDEVCFSEQQYDINEFFSNNSQKTLSVIAPTSYGKSELILSAIKQFSGKKVCVITSTKALLMQTKKRVQKIGKENYSKVIVHPEMYSINDSSLLAILTQERLLRLFKKDLKLFFDCIIVDEAHEMLEKGSRSNTLTNAIIIAQKRNPKAVFKFLTPFLTDESNLKVRYTSYDLEGYKVNEYIKTEKYYIYDLRNGKGLIFYDQFLNEFINIPNEKTLNFEEEVVNKFAAKKNIISAL